MHDVRITYTAEGGTVSNPYQQQPQAQPYPQPGQPYPPQPQGWQQPPGYPPQPQRPYPTQAAPQVQVVVQQNAGAGPRSAVSQGQMGYARAAFHWTMMLMTVGLWTPVYLSARRKMRTVTTFR